MRIDEKRRLQKEGIVYLVGAGPGDPGLITAKGLRCIRKADVIVYDRLIPKRLLQEAPASAELIYVGKSPDGHTLKQDEINELLVEKAAQGLTVTRLKGGDPFVFGRGGEEAALLADHHILFEIVPGITSAVAVPAYAGIPVTHCGLSSSFTVVTGHEDPEKAESDLDWPALARGKSTLIFLMGMGNLAKITKRLIAEGLSPATPAAIIQQGAGARQRTLVATAGSLVSEAERGGFTHPAIIVIGETVSLREQLQWFEQKPLFGKRIVVTRAREQAGAFSEKLEKLGAETIEFPAIKIEDPLDYGPLDRSLESGFEKILIIGHIGKLIKVAAGIFNTHSRVADARFEIFAAHAALLGAGLETIKKLEEAVTTEEMCDTLAQLGGADLFDNLATKISGRSMAYLHDEAQIGTVIFNFRRGLLGMDRQAKQIMEDLKRQF